MKKLTSNIKTVVITAVALGSVLGGGGIMYSAFLGFLAWIGCNVWLDEEGKAGGLDAIVNAAHKMKQKEWKETIAARQNEDENTRDIVVKIVK